MVTTVSSLHVFQEQEFCQQTKFSARRKNLSDEHPTKKLSLLLLFDVCTVATADKVLPLYTQVIEVVTYVPLCTAVLYIPVRTKDSPE